MPCRPPPLTGAQQQLLIELSAAASPAAVGHVRFKYLKVLNTLCGYRFTVTGHARISVADSTMSHFPHPCNVHRLVLLLLGGLGQSSKFTCDGGRTDFVSDSSGALA